MKNMLFIVPNNDGESVEIQRLLKANNSMFLVTQQTWGASWDRLEDEIKDKINSFEGLIYGIELQGKPINNGINIDHHKYENDDRSNSLSSLEQVAILIDAKLSYYQKAVSDNDKGHMKLMYRNGFDNATVSLVREQDRKAQGITDEDEKAAEDAIKKIQIKNKLAIVELPHSKCATVTDRLYNKYDNLLIICGDGELDFYGNGYVCEKLHLEFGGWIGGQLPEYGFWGNHTICVESIIYRIQTLL